MLLPRPSSNRLPAGDGQTIDKHQIKQGLWHSLVKVTSQVSHFQRDVDHASFRDLNISINSAGETTIGFLGKCFVFPVIR